MINFSEEFDLETMISEGNSLVTFLNHYSFLCVKDEAQVFSRFNYIYCDGFLLRFFVKNFLGINVRKLSFDNSSIAPAVFDYAERSGSRTFFVGGDITIAEKAANEIIKLHPELVILGYSPGFFESEKSRALLIAKLVELQVEIVVCSMGTPYQERFLVDLQDSGWRGVGFTSGGFFHQVAKFGHTYYPNWVLRLNMRWLYRIIKEPYTFPRYTYYLMIFFFVFFSDYFQNKRKKTK